MMIINPSTDRLVFVRFKDRFIFELAVRNAAGTWVWYEAAFCRRDQRTYLVETEIGEPEAVPVYCHDGELVAVFWVDPDLVPEDRIDRWSGGPCARLKELPAFLRGESFRTFCAELGYAAEMIPCINYQDMLPISGGVPDASQPPPCEHLAWCSTCGMWSSPNFPGKEEEMKQCPHRTADDLYYAGANTA